jgi:hypothetical protein
VILYRAGQFRLAGGFVGSSATIIGRTVLFYFTWAATDLLAPP